MISIDNREQIFYFNYQINMLHIYSVIKKNFLKRKGIDAEKLKAGVVGDAGSQFDIYKDTKGNLWAVKKGDKPEESDLWLDNLDNY